MTTTRTPIKFVAHLGRSGPYVWEVEQETAHHVQARLVAFSPRQRAHRNRLQIRTTFLKPITNNAVRGAAEPRTLDGVVGQGDDR